MTLGAVQVGHVVLDDREGTRFFAIVNGKGQGELEVEPIDRRVTYRRVKARDVVEIWHKRGTRSGCVSEDVRSAA